MGWALLHGLIEFRVPTGNLRGKSQTRPRPALIRVSEPANLQGETCPAPVGSKPCGFRVWTRLVAILNGGKDGG